MSAPKAGRADRKLEVLAWEASSDHPLARILATIREERSEALLSSLGDFR